MSKCVICGKEQDQKFRPFCSKRCADVDLNRWLNGSYAIPAAEEDDPDANEVPNDGAKTQEEREQ
jgi:endogenous inhibitor of DNA gyrase (YacG/DUF329 family)